MRKILLILLYLVTTTVCYSQGGYTVKGVVVGRQQEPIIGATILERGTTNGVTTALDGSFTLDVSSPKSVIRITYVGYVPRELLASSSLFASPIVIEQDAVALDDVVVIGYGSVKKSDLTGSVSSIKISENNQVAYTSPQQMLQGKVSGLLITPGDGGPGSESVMRIRGSASLNASNNPLIVIDGVPIESGGISGLANPLLTINPSDIESFTILKDASSTAIYGSRASNGVIIITTRKGTSDELKVSYNSTYSVDVNTQTIDVMSSAEYRDYMLSTHTEGSNATTVQNLLGDSDTDWQELIFRPAFSTNQNLSIYGRVKDWMPYRVSAGYTYEKGTLKTSDLERTTVNVSLTPTLLDKHLKISLNAQGSYNDNNFANAGAINTAAAFDPTQDVNFLDANGDIDYNKTNGWWNWLTESGAPNNLAQENPLSMLHSNYSSSRVQNFIGNAQIDYRMHFLPELRANLNLGMDRTYSRVKNGTMPQSFSALKDASVLSGDGRNYHGEELRTNNIFELYLAYANEIDKHRFDAMGGYSWQHFYQENNNISRENITGTVIDDPDVWMTEHYLLSFFGRINYTYNEKYLFTATLRNDASSRFSKNNRWGLFPSAALAWNVYQEDWMRSYENISNLKLRLSWGVTGQQNINQGDYPYIPRYTLYQSPNTNYPLNGNNVQILSPEAYNPDIQWESTGTFNVGVDIGFYNDRIIGTLDYYHRRTKNLLNMVSVPMGSNFSNTVISNIGNMRNQGVELGVTAIVAQNNNMSWSVGFNATYQEIEITKLTSRDNSDYIVMTGGVSGGTGSTVQAHKVGHAPFSFYTYQQVYNPDGTPLHNTFVDQNGDGQITAADLYFSDKKPTPDFFFGLNSMVTYENWTFSFNSHASFGNWAYNGFYASNSTTSQDLNQGFLTNLPKEVFRTGFTKPNDNEQIISDYFLENASFFKLDDVSLGYAFNNVMDTETDLNLSFSVQNVFTITKYSGLDPENSGIDNNLWPRPRTFTLRLGVSF